MAHVYPNAISHIIRAPSLVIASHAHSHIVCNAHQPHNVTHARLDIIYSMVYAITHVRLARTCTTKQSPTMMAQQQCNNTVESTPAFTIYLVINVPYACTHIWYITMHVFRFVPRAHMCRNCNVDNVWMGVRSVSGLLDVQNVRVGTICMICNVLWTVRLAHTSI